MKINSGLCPSVTQNSIPFLQLTGLQLVSFPKGI